MRERIGSKKSRVKTQEALEGLLSSLPDSDPLRRLLPAIPEIAETTPLSAKIEATSHASTFGPPGAGVCLVSQR